VQIALDGGIVKVRRRWAALVPATVLSLALAGCGSSDNGGSGGGSGGTKTVPSTKQNDITATPRDQLQDGGTFTWVLTQIPTNYNYNELDGTLADNANVINALLPWAFYTDGAGTPYVNKDFLDDATLTSTDPTQVVTYKINPKAVWYDGTKITAADFIAQWKALNGKNPAFKISSSTGYDAIADVKQGASDHEVVVTFKTKYADWKALFAPLYPASTNTDPKVFNDGWTQQPLTTAGPFKLDKIDKTAKTITLVRNDKWWGKPARLEKIVYRAIDSDAQVDSLASGEIDEIDIGPDVDKYTRAKAIQGVTLHKAGGPNFRHLTMNSQSAVLKDVNVRQALAMGIDRTRIAAALLGPLEVPAVPLNNHIFMTNQTGYQDNSGDVGKYNPDKAKQMLDAAGWTLPSGGTYRQKAGKELDVKFVIPSQVATSEKESKQVQAMLKEIGVKVNINTVPSDDFFDKYVTPGNFDFTVFSWLGTPYPISSNKSIYANPKGENIQQNYARVGSAEIDSLFDQATAELDENKARGLANQIDALIWKEVHSLTTYQRPEIVAVKSNVANFGAFGFANVIYEDIGLKK
jgi:peptide/nickel transport system substrate-binding protein